jgi:L1 cell adhesion molecule like protein
MLRIPCILAYQDDIWMVGEFAEEYAWKYLDTTIYDTKCMLGCMLGCRCDKKLMQQSVEKEWSFRICEDTEGGILIEINENDVMVRHRPEDLSGKILMEVTQRAEDRLDQRVDGVVISVPAYFTEAQKGATLEAGRCAGLEVLGLIEDPVAVAMAYWYPRPSRSRKTAMVFDLGGSGLDVSLVEIKGREYGVVAVARDSHLGGRDFDRRLFDYCLQEFDPKVRLSEIDPPALCSLRTLVPKVKVWLSERDEVTVFVNDFFGDRDLKVLVTRRAFEEACRGLLSRVLDPVAEVLRSSVKTLSDLDQVFIVGGGSQIPAVRALITDYFVGYESKIVAGYDPELVVSFGARWMAHEFLENGARGSGPCTDLILVRGYRICQLNLGIDIDEDRMFTVIRRGECLPIRRTSRFPSVIRGELRKKMKVIEGPWKIVSKNTELHEFKIQRSVSANLGKRDIQVTFDLSWDGVLDVEVDSDPGRSPRKVLRFRQADMLGRAERVRVVLAEWECERENDQRMADEAERRAVYGDLDFNMRALLAGATVESCKINRLLGDSGRRGIFEVLGAVPGHHVTPLKTWEEIEHLKTALRERLERVFGPHTYPFPTWLSAAE